MECICLFFPFFPFYKMLFLLYCVQMHKIHKAFQKCFIPAVSRCFGGAGPGGQAGASPIPVPCPNLGGGAYSLPAPPESLPDPPEGEGGSRTASWKCPHGIGPGVGSAKADRPGKPLVGRDGEWAAPGR